MTRAPKRRWFRFSLRALFVVVTACALFLGWLSWNLPKVLERDRFLKGFVVVTFKPTPARQRLYMTLYDPYAVPYSWRLLGAKPVGNWVQERDGIEEEELERLRGLFPEARFSLMKPEP